MEQALASPGLFSDDDGAAASPVLESTATGFGADVRKDLLSEFSAISPNLEGSQQVRLEPFCHAPSSAVSREGCVLHTAQNGRAMPPSVVLSSGAGFGVTSLDSCSSHEPKMCWCMWKCMKRCSGVFGNLGSSGAHSHLLQMKTLLPCYYCSTCHPIIALQPLIVISFSSPESGPRWADLDRISLSTTGDVQFSIWVSFFEIYNELIYDLLEPALPGQNRKRQTLRLCEDQTGNPYVKDLNWINVRDADEAWKLLKLGRKNQSFASTHMNQNSSRSHSIFSIRILHLQGGGREIVPKISELSLCDLAGSERCKDQKSGDRMKEANNINTSLHTLGRCITALRQKQQSKVKQIVVPFRDSKLTRVFQGFFTGRGRSCMIVNINQCASTYDETLYVAKFSAIASQLVQAPPTKLGLPSIQSIIKEHSRRTSQGSEATQKEEEKTEDSEDEADVSVYEREDLLRVVEAARELLVQERQEKLQLEIHLRTEICNEMLETMQQKEQWWSQHIDAQKELLEELYEDKLSNLKESLTDYYQEEIQERDEKIEELQAALQEAKQKLDAKQRDSEQSLRRSKRVAASCALQQELTDTKAKLEQCQKELNTTSSELRKYQRLLEPPPSAKPITVDVDKKLEDGQKNVRLLRSELQKLGESLQSAERACCHSTGAGKLREALCMCDDILARQDQTLAELQNNMMLVKLDLRKKAACIAEQYHTVQKLQAPPMSTLKKRFCANRENLQPNQPPGKKPFLHNLLTRSAPRPAATRGWQLRSVAL
uniref:Kinesin-like protein n=1 Tax=Pavo cristatus TaxID=9049 RepID=A0A8C9ELZ6_PAVCR